MAKGRMMNKRIAKSDKIAALAKDRYRTVYFMLYPHLDREGRYSADPRDIKEDCVPRLKYSLSDISEALNALHEVGLITIYTVNGRQYLEASRFDDFQVGLHKDREAPSDIPANPGPTLENSGNFRTDAEKVPLNLNLKVKVNLKVKDNVGLTDSVIEFLNQKTGKNFSSKAEKTIGHINARVAEGRTLDDFKRVISIKAAKWNGDPKMNDYLRPETLFGMKFESYLNEFLILSPAEQERMVGASPEKTDAEKVRAAAVKKSVDEYVKKMQAKWEPLVEAAKTPEERNKLRAAANAETQEGIRRIRGGEESS